MKLKVKSKDDEKIVLIFGTSVIEGKELEITENAIATLSGGEKTYIGLKLTPLQIVGIHKSIEENVLIVIK